ncbi:MAG: phosphoribosylanthranilate isomerase [Prevotella sp.]
MIIKVCGLKEPDNIREVESLGVDMTGFIFYKKSRRYVSLLPSHAGTLPDYVGKDLSDRGMSRSKRVGVFVDEMPQTIVSMAYNYALDYIQLHGDETTELIDNLRSTIVPDIRDDIKFIKAISVGSADDVKRWRKYDGKVDMLLFDTKGAHAGGNGTQFDWSVLDAYDGEIPFLLSGGITPEDAPAILNIRHPMFAGVDINSRFEISPGIKDINLIRGFVNKLR